jgi:hypothetical protein
MKPRIGIITLNVSDLEQSLAFLAAAESGVFCQNHEGSIGSQ